MNNIHVLININNPSVLAPTETGMVDHETNFDALNFIDVFEVPTIGYLGGITLLWKISAITIERFVLTEKEIHSIIEDGHCPQDHHTSMDNTTYTRKIDSPSLSNQMTTNLPKIWETKATILEDGDLHNMTYDEMGVYKDPVHMFYANLRLSPDSSEFKTLVLGTRIVLNNFLFENFFDTKFSGEVPFMNSNWSNEFEVGFEESKKFLSNSDSLTTNFGSLSLCFKYCIMAHIVATTLIPRKKSLSNIICRDVFVLYCLPKKIKINWVTWIREYMLESIREANASTSLPYRLLITQILLFYFINLSDYLSIEVAVTYDSRTFSSMGYVLVEDEWCRNEFAHAKVEPLKVSKSVSNPSVSLMKKLEEFKQWFKAIEEGIMQLQEGSCPL
ncbi:putative iron/ascorbate oxidoreductase-like isoform X1 [Capsicum annuum]|nr:putative iron/ascorbate oxidoreductase-like isoform X1 [Capsicum annuum]